MSVRLLSSPIPCGVSAGPSPQTHTETPWSLGDACVFVSKQFLLGGWDLKLNYQGFVDQSPSSGETERSLGHGLGTSPTWTGRKGCPVWRSPQPNTWDPGKRTLRSHVGLGSSPVKEANPVPLSSPGAGMSGWGPEEARTGSLWNSELIGLWLWRPGIPSAEAWAASTIGKPVGIKKILDCGLWVALFDSSGKPLCVVY